MARCLAAWVMLALLCAATSPPADPYRLDEVKYAMLQPGVKVTVQWMTCGELNAFYVPVEGNYFPLGHLKARTVVMCDELKAELSPAVIRYIFAHEMAHAVIIQRDLPYTGLHETAADELAAVIMGLYGWADDIEAGGRWWFQRGFRDVENGEPVEHWYDAHAGDKRRGATLLCLAAGAKLVSGDFLTIENDRLFRYDCDEREFDRKRQAWWTLLAYDEP